MRLYALLAAFAIALATGGPQAGLTAPAPIKPPAKKLEEAIKGKWQMTSRVDDGEVTPEATVKLRTMNVEADAYSIFESDRLWVRCTYKLNPAKKPAWFDATFAAPQAGAQTQLGIVKVEGDTMILCIAREGRPNDFKCPPGSGRILVTYKRIKK